MRTTGLCKTISVMGLMGGMAVSPQLLASPVEHAVDTAGVSGFVGLAYGDHTVNASLSNAFEVDGYTFAAEAGDQIKLLLHTQTAWIDASAVLRDPMGTVVNSTGCSAPWYSYTGLCSAAFDQTIATAGTYTLNFSDSGANNAGNYELHLERFPPVNNWVGFAYGTPFADKIDHATDMDFMAFQGKAGTGVRLTIASNTGDIDPYVEIWDPSGASFKTLSCSGTGCTASVDLALSATGIYKVGIYDSGLEEVGNYTLGVNCLYGVCPAGIPTAPVPEPETYAMLLAGLGTIGVVARRRKLF
jgi:hypothetical protein